VGKFVEVTAKDAFGQPVVHLAKLFEYEQGGIWLHFSKDVVIAGGRARPFEGYLFIPHEQLVHVFGSDGLDSAVEEAAEKGAGT
jgi:hypothetical protein